MNGLPLNLIPLRKHPEDILALLEHFREIRGYHFTLAPDAVAFLLHYPWQGNVRELINCVDYCGNLFQEEIALHSLPAYMLRSKALTQEPEGRLVQQEEDIMRAVLQLVLNAKHTHRHLGRRSLCHELEQAGLFFTEYELRMLLQKMSEQGLLLLRPGRAGTVITMQGESYLSGNIPSAF